MLGHGLLSSTLLLVTLVAGAAAQNPSGTAPLAEREVTIETADPEIVLAGTLTLPAGKGPHPAALLIAGSGAHTRDQMISGTPMFRLIGDHLVRHGIATLRVDKRGVGKSTGPKNIDDCTRAEFAVDARAGFHFLQEEEEIDPDRVGLIGHSEGAMVAPMVAVQEPAVRFVVLLAPPSVPGAEIWVMQRLMLAKQANTAVDAAALEKALRRFVAFGASGQNDDATYYDIGREFLLAHGKSEAEITHVLIDGFLSDFRRPWYRFFLSHDPGAVLGTLTTPTLAFLGSADVQVPVSQNLEPLTAALVAAKNADFTVTVLPDQDHFFFTFEGHRLERHRFGKMEMNQRLLDAMTSWIATHVR